MPFGDQLHSLRKGQPGVMKKRGFGDHHDFLPIREISVDAVIIDSIATINLK
jgi:hypothetical protein